MCGSVAPPLSLSTAGTDRRQHQGLPICCVISGILPNRVSPSHLRLSACSNTTTYTPSTRLLIHFTAGSPSSAPWEGNGSAGRSDSINVRRKHTSFITNTGSVQGDSLTALPSNKMTAYKQTVCLAVVPLGTEQLSDTDRVITVSCKDV